jgi:two-component system, OmpR family, phosphate regulon sensor histidine kinase PhoR
MARRGWIRPRTLTGRLLLWHAAAVLGVLLSLGLVLDRVLEGYFVGQLTDSLVAQARTVQRSLPQDDTLQPFVVQLGEAIGARITVIRTDGVVLADSEHDPTTMENHLGRPEVRLALSGEVGVSSRDSATIGIPFRYVALPPSDGRIVRLALPLTEVDAKQRSVRLILLVGFGLAALAGLLTLIVIARGLTRPLNSISVSVERVGRGDLSAEVPESGTEEVAALARTVNRMRGEVSARIDEMERDRMSRDAILSSLEEGVLLFDRDGATLYQNTRGHELLGGEAAGARALAAPALREAVARAAAGQNPKPVEVLAGPASRDLLATTASLPAGQVLLVLRDVTAARKLDAVRRDFVANASHELKTPVASIQALAETMAATASGEPEAVARFARQLEREAIRLSRLVSDLLDLSRLEVGTADQNVLRLDELVRSEAELLRGRAEDAGVAFASTADSPLEVIGSDRDLRLLVRNLLENAIQYTRPGGSVGVSAGREGDWAVLVVRDTGIGIPSKDQGRVFERFYRVDRARSRETGGTGLGLSIVKHVAENHGGTVSVESALGEGSTFTVRLPISS